MSDSVKKILLVEGNSSLAKMIQTGLEKADYEVTVVDSGRDAWDTIGKGFDALITDYMMSDSVGAKICDGVRQHRKHKNMPMVVLSGERNTDLAKLKDEFGLISAFQKPLSVNALVAAINGHFGIGDPPAEEPAEAPAAEAPAEEAPAEEAPAEEAPAEEAPAEEAPAEEAPAEEAPAAEPPAGEPEAAPADPEKSE